jgi:hypothetical protein
MFTRCVQDSENKHIVAVDAEEHTIREPVQQHRAPAIRKGRRKFACDPQV